MLTDTSSPDETLSLPDTQTPPDNDISVSINLPDDDISESRLNTGTPCGNRSPVSSRNLRNRQSATSSKFSEYMLGASLISQSETSGNQSTLPFDDTRSSYATPTHIRDDIQTGVRTRSSLRQTGQDSTAIGSSSSNLFYGSIELGDAINLHIFKLPWPPSSHNLNLPTAETTVPPPLYNFLASTCGLSDKNTPPDPLQFITLPAAAVNQRSFD